MKQPSITVVIGSNTYTLRTDDLQGMRDMPVDDRDHLIRLLEALKAQREKSARLVQDTLAKPVGTAAQSRGDGTEGTAPKERLGKGDVDAIMARLIMEERQQQKPGIKPATIYMFAAAIIVIIALLSLF